MPTIRRFTDASLNGELGMCGVRAFGLLVLMSWILSARMDAADKVSDWPQFRGPSGQGRNNETGLPVEWTSTKNILWKATLPGLGSSSPIVLDERVYLTCYLGHGIPGEPGDINQLNYRVVCLWAKDGSILWQVDVEPKLPLPFNTRERHGYTSSTLASDGKSFYAFFGTSGVFAFDEIGRRRWACGVGSRVDDWGSGSSPILFQDLLIINASAESDHLVGLHRKTGRVAWKVKGIRDSWNTPVLVEVEGGKQELVLATRGFIYGFAPQTGEQLWSCETGLDSYMVPSIVAEHGVVYCIGGKTGRSLAVRAGGTGNVTATHRLWVLEKGANVTSPVLTGGHLYWMHETLGIAYCVEAATGKLVYEQRVDGADQVFASPVAADGKLYFVTRSGQTFVIAAKPDYELLARNDVLDRDYFNASPAIYKGRLFLRSDRTLYCIGKK